MAKTEEVIVTDSKTGGQKGTKLLRYDLIPPDAMDMVACVYGEGAKKYADRNWERGYNWGLSIAALERHLSKFKQRKDWDTEEPNPTGCHHMAQVAWHALTLLTFALRGLGTDDRSLSCSPKTPSD